MTNSTSASLGRFVLVLGILLGLPCFAAMSEVQAQDILSKQVQSTTVTRENFQLLLGDLAMKYKVPIGVEYPVFGEETKPKEPASIGVRAESVRQILDGVMVVAPEFQWSNMDGVVNVNPLTNREPLLNVIIQDFKVENQKTAEIVNQLLESPVVKKELVRMNLIRDETTPIPGWEPRESHLFSFHLYQVTVREILNYLVRITGNGFWSIHRVGRERQYVSVLVW